MGLLDQCRRARDDGRREARAIRRRIAVRAVENAVWIVVLSGQIQTVRNRIREAAVQSADGHQVGLDGAIRRGAERGVTGELVGGGGGKPHLRGVCRQIRFGPGGIDGDHLARVRVDVALQSQPGAIRDHDHRPGELPDTGRERGG